MILWPEAAKVKAKLLPVHPEHPGLLHAQLVTFVRREHPQLEEHSCGDGHRACDPEAHFRDVQEGALPK
jgi:hypothetical protein